MPMLIELMRELREEYKRLNADLSEYGTKDDHYESMPYGVGKRDGLKMAVPLARAFEQLEKLMATLHDGEVLTRSESSECSTPEDAYTEGAENAEKRILAELRRIVGSGAA